MARFVNAAANAFSAGYDIASPNKDKNNKTAYQRYVEKFYGPGVTSHNDPLAIARAATGAVASGLKSGAGFLSHAAAGLVGAPQGPSRTTAAPSQGRGGIGSDTGAVSGITPTNRLYGGNPGTGAGISGYTPGTTRQGMDGVLDAISRAEGTTKNGYNEVLGYGAYGRPSKPITDMTLQEVHDFGRNTLFAGQRAAGKTGPLSSATGRYQITGDNIKAYSKKWGLDMKTTKWTPQLQDRIALDLAKNTPKGLANWEGFKTKTGQKLKQQAIAALNGQNVSSTAATASAASGDPQVAQLQKDLVAQGAKITVDGIMGPQTRKAMADYPDTAMAYTSTDTPQTPAQQAAAAEAAGRAPSESGSISRRGSDVAAMQRDLNSRGAKLTVDGLEGPLTRQAAQQFYGSPTSVRTPSFTASPPTPANNWSSLQSPYTNGTGGANALVSSVRTPSFTYDPTNSRQVPTVAVHSDVRSKSPIPGYYDSQAGSNQTIQGGRRVPVSTGYSPPTGPVLTGGFSPPAQTQNQWSSLQGPYMGSTGGANAIVQPAQTARIPQARPDYPTSRIPQARPNYQPPQAPLQQGAVPTAGMSLGDLQALAEKYGVPVGHIADVASDIGSRASSAVREGMSHNAGNNYSGGNYSGGSYGGAGGRSITSGVGGAYKNR